MSSPDFAGIHDDFGDDFGRDEKDVHLNGTAQFDRGARAFAFGCAILYAVLSGGLIVAIVKATLQL